MTRIAAILSACLTLPLPAQTAERVTSPTRVTGEVFVDANANGSRDPGERGVPGVAVSDQASIVSTAADGRFVLDAGGYGIVFIEQPDGFAVRGPTWRRAEPGAHLTFALTAVTPVREFTFVHASDTHISEQSLPRTRRLRELVDSLAPAFVLISGDLVRDALRVPESEALGYYEMLERELLPFTVPVFTVPGNHEIFGIERHQSLVSQAHRLYGKRMYRSFRGPNYYAFDWGGVHFVGLDTVDYLDLWYHGHVDSLQLAWLEQDIARLPAGRPVVTFNHIPLVSAAPFLSGVVEDGVAPTIIRTDGTPRFRHTVHNAQAVLAILGDRLEIALGGHIHRSERLRFETAAGTRRFFQTAAVTGPATGHGPLGHRSGVTQYRVSDGRVDDGTFIPLDANAARAPQPERPGGGS